MTSSFQENLTSILRLVRRLGHASAGKEIFTPEETQQIEIICAELALLAIDASDTAAESKASGIEKAKAREAASALSDLADAALSMQSWRSLSEGKEAGFISLLFEGNVERMQACARRLIAFYPEAAPEPEPIPRARALAFCGEDDLHAISVIIDHSEEDQIRLLMREIKLLKEQLAALILEREHLYLVERPHLVALYNAKIGWLEAELYHAETEMRAARRKLEIIRAKLNRQEVLSESEVSEILMEEYRIFRERYDEWIRQILENAREAAEREQREKEAAAAENSGTDENGKPKKADDIKSIYRRIVKSMHPDLHPNQTEEEKELFKKAMGAYKKGDIETLRAIEQMINGDAPEEAGAKTLEALLAEKEDLLRQIRKVADEITQLKDSWPFSQAELLADEEQVKAKQEELKQKIKVVNEAEQKYKQRAEELIKEHGKQ